MKTGWFITKNPDISDTSLIANFKEIMEVLEEACEEVAIPQLFPGDFFGNRNLATDPSHCQATLLGNCRGVTGSV